MVAVKKRTAIADAVAAVRDDLDAIRDRIADLEAERSKVAHAPVDRGEAEARVRGVIARAQARALFDRQELFGANGGQLGEFFMEALRREPLAALAALVPDQLSEAFLENHPGGGLSPDARAARLADLERDLQATEIAEEVACREIEAATGATVTRRLDADPAVLLAPDRELEGDAA